jgi:hypothetical protein
MKKILRLVTTSVLTLTLVACGEASSSVSNGTTTSSSVASVSSAYANVTSLTLTAASNLLTQVMGSQRTVTITGALNANTNPNLQLEWFVNGVKQSQTGRLLDFTPVTAGSYVVTARVGNIVSNNLTISVGNPTIDVTGAMFVNSRLIEVTGQAGATVTLVGATLSDNAYYSLAKGKYVLELDEAVDQGTQVTVRLERAGFTPTVQSVTFDTRVLEVEDVQLGSDDLLPVNGVYEVVRPFDAASTHNKTVTINLLQRNIIPLAPATSNYVIEVTNPAGVKTVSTNSVQSLSAYTLTVNSLTAVGTWTFKFTLDQKTQEVKLNVLQPVAEILLDPKGYTFTDPETGLPVNYEMRYTRSLDEAAPADANSNGFADDSGEFLLPVTKDSSGAFVVEKPFATFKTTAGSGSAHYIEFNVMARNFVEPEFADSQISVSLTGPTSFSSTPSTLFGFELEDTTNGDNDDDLITLSAFDSLNNASKTGGADETSAYHNVKQFIDRGTPTGTYTFTVKAGELGKEISKDIVVKIVEPTPKVEFILDSYVTVSGNVTRIHELKETSNNVFEIEKPLSESRNYALSWYSVVKNIQSALVTDFELIANESVKDAEDRTIFDGTSGLKQIKNSILVPLGATNYDLGKLELSTLSGVSDVVFTRDTNADITYTVPTLTAAASESYEVNLGSITVGANVAAGTSITLTATATGGNIELDNFGGDATASTTKTIEIIVSDFNEVVQFGGKNLTNSAGFSGANYRLVNMSMDVSGPSNLLEEVEAFKAAVLLADNTDTFMLVNQLGANTNKQTAIREALDDDYLLLDTALVTTADSFTTNTGLLRPVLNINKATVAGNYKMTLDVNGVKSELTLIVKNPQPKIFVLSGLDTDGTRVPVVGKGDDFSTSPDLSVETPTYNLLKVKNTVDTDDNVDADDVFVEDTNGEFNFFIPTGALTANTNVLRAQIAIADVALGEYNYSIVKKYPDGRVLTFADKATVTSVDVHNLAVFGTTAGVASTPQNTIFNTNWKIEEALYEEGQYEYEFTFAGVTKKWIVNALPQPGLDINEATVGNTELSLFEGDYLILTAKMLGQVKLSFDLNGLTGDNYFRLNWSATGTPGFTFAPVWTQADANFSTEIYSLKDLQELVLGNVTGTATVGKDLILKVKFYEKVNKPFTGTNAAAFNNGKDSFDVVGVDQVITIKVRAAIAVGA